MYDQHYIAVKYLTCLVEKTLKRRNPLMNEKFHKKYNKQLHVYISSDSFVNLSL